jgi:hypothetical protein
MLTLICLLLLARGNVQGEQQSQKVAENQDAFKNGSNNV